MSSALIPHPNASSVCDTPANQNKRSIWNTVTSDPLLRGLDILEINVDKNTPVVSELPKDREYFVNFQIRPCNEWVLTQFLKEVGSSLQEIVGEHYMCGKAVTQILDSWELYVPDCPCPWMSVDHRMSYNCYVTVPVYL